MENKYTLEEIDELVFKYQKTNDTESIKILLKLFERFIIKYVNFLKFGIVGKHYDSNIRQLFNMMVSTRANSDIGSINKIFQDIDVEDLIPELQMIFINNVKRFKKQKDGPNFTGYVYNYYKYSITEFFRKLSSDAMSHKAIIPAYNTDDVDAPEDADSVIENRIETKIEFENLCFSTTKKISQLEKYILYLTHEKDLSGIEIANLFNISPSSIDIIKRNAQKKIKRSKFSDYQL
jgi:RNA polymerase sigma factor (sigma-70 family)